MDEAREEVARRIGARPSEILFTSGGTESNALAWQVFSQAGETLVTSNMEHPCVLAAAQKADDRGARVSYVGAERTGGLRKSDFEAYTASPVKFVSIQHANNETGVVHPLPTMIQQAKAASAAFHTDAVQSVGKLPIDVAELGVDYLSLSGHKLGALSGIGALYVRKGSPLEPIWSGGHQEKGRRTGTENVLGILSLGAACRALRDHGVEENRRVERLRNLLESELLNRIPGTQVTGRAETRLPNTTHLMFENVDGESLLIAADLEGIDGSTGAACASGSLEPSHVLLAMGFSPTQAHGSLRLSLGWSTTQADIDRVVELLPKLVAQVREVRQNIRPRLAL